MEIHPVFFGSLQPSLEECPLIAQRALHTEFRLPVRIIDKPCIYYFFDKVFHLNTSLFMESIDGLF